MNHTESFHLSHHDLDALAIDLRSKATDFDPSQFVDRYEEAVVEMVKKKQAGMPVSRELVAPRPQNCLNLMDAFRHSIAQEQAASAPAEEGAQAH